MQKILKWNRIVKISLLQEEFYKRKSNSRKERFLSLIHILDKTFVFANPNKKSISIQEFERERFVELMQDEEDRNEFADT